jgi:hypothetical protein
MGGGLMQLVAYGAQDIYLTGNPQITFFKVVYRRHTNFAMESIEQTFNGDVALGRRVTATISRNGDLIKDMWLECQIDTLTSASYGLGNALVKQAEIEIGGQLIDRQYGEWMNIWTELSTPAGKRDGYDEMVGNSTAAGKIRSNLDVPLQFWFNRNPGLALPLIALQYHEVKLNLDLEAQGNLGGSVALGAGHIKLYVDYIYLDTDERRRFAQVSHEYLIEQVQFTGDESLTTGSNRIDLSFNHPVKELIWVATDDYTGRSNDQACQFAYLDFTEAKLQLNGHDRFTARRPEYFFNVQPYKHHTNMPRAGRFVGADGAGGTTQGHDQHIHVYSFALNPEEHQPSGTCNFSRIDNATLTFSGLATRAVDRTTGTTPGVLKVFALNYNVLRIMSGMGGLAYSN